MIDEPLLVSAGLLVDGLGGAPVPDAGVLIGTDGSISWAGPMAQVPGLSEGCRRIAVPGTILPGFIDTHVHFALPGGGLNVAALLVQPAPIRVLTIAAAMRSTLDAGVTTVRDLGFLGPSLAKMATLGATPAPRLLNAITMVSGSGGHGDFPFPPGLDASALLSILDVRSAVADGRDAVTKAVRELIRDGAQVIKVAASGGITTPADGPDDLGLCLDEMRAAVEAAASRGRTVAAHAIGTEGIAIAVQAGVHSIEHGNGLTPALADRMAEQGTFFVPTLAVLAQTENPDVMGQEVYDKAAPWRAATRKAIPMAVQAGVRIAAGTDAGLGIEHGHNLTELALLVDAGLSAMDAIVAGTRTAADVCGLGDQVGSLEPGKRADVVVAAGNPLDDITLLGNPANITLVLQDGRVVKS